jgi:ribonuclease P protein component
METNNKYAKIEKLKSKKAIDLLFRKGKSINASPLRLVYLPKLTHEGFPISMGITVSKKNIKLAVNRNLIKRRVREAYRLNNNELKFYMEAIGVEINIMFIYTSKQILSYKEIETKIKVILTRLIEVSEKASE